MPYVVGLDLSLTDTGLAVVSDDGRAQVGRISSKPPPVRRHERTGKPLQATLAQRRTRLSELAQQIVFSVGAPSLAVIEQPAFSQSGGQHHDRSGLWWLVVEALAGRGVPVAEVTPGSVKKYATGKGVGGKDQVVAAVVRRYPNVDVNDNNEADALVLACMGARHLGFPLEGSLPKVNLESMAAVRWPA